MKVEIRQQTGWDYWKCQFCTEKIFRGQYEIIIHGNDPNYGTPTRTTICCACAKDIGEGVNNH